jgi:hypothetical protein
MYYVFCTRVGADEVVYSVLITYGQVIVVSPYIYINSRS